MKIVYDHQIFSMQRFGGISRYFYELMRALKEDVEIETTFLVTNNHYALTSDFLSQRSFFANTTFKGKARLIKMINRFYSLYVLKKGDFDLFHPTYYDPYFLRHIGHKPFVLTVYDMIHEKFPDMYSENDLVSRQKRVLAEAADKIIAISENTKKDLVELFGISASKVDVVYLGSSMSVPERSAPVVDTPSKYILFVGRREIYKNFERAIAAIAPLMRERDGLHLLCAGGGPITAEEEAHFSRLEITGRVVQHDVDDSALAALYSRAQVFIFPSLYEGFGIPILEAFACRCAIACSDTSSLPEVAGDAASYFDPGDGASIRQAVAAVLDNKDFRETLIEKGTERLKLFSWEKAAAETKKVYESIL